MKNILIVEDDLKQALTLEKILSEISDDINILKSNSVTDAKSVMDKIQIDLFIIDIHLGDELGIDLARHIRSFDKYKLTWILFCTTHIKYMIEAFTEIHCYDYLIKPLNKEKVKACVSTLLSNSTLCNKSSGTDDFLLFDNQDLCLKVFTKDIIFIEVFFRNSIIHTLNGVFEIPKTPLKNILNMISSSNLLQSHRSYIVNIDKISRIEKKGSSWTVFFEDYKTTALVGGKYKKNILDNFNSFKS